MRRSVGLGLLFTLAGPFVLAAQGVPAAPAALKVDSLAQAANAAAAANTVAINFVWTLIAGFLVMSCRPGSPWWRPVSRGPRTPPTPSP